MKVLIVSLIALCLWGCNGQKPVSLSSPDNRIRVDVFLDNQSAPAIQSPTRTRKYCKHRSWVLRLTTATLPAT